MPISGDRKSLAHQARIAFRVSGFDRQGGKANRRQQMLRACTVCDWVQRNCQVNHLGQVGGRQVVQFWKSHQELAESTRYGYWLALCQLWRFSGKAGEPPRPFADRGEAAGVGGADAEGGGGGA
jgi:hypothetical protein